jgi:uncharacterized protein DUF2637
VSRVVAVLATGWTRRRAANVGTLVLALANAVISYDALAAAARSAGLPMVLSWLFPLATDGIIAVATPAQLELRDRNAPGWVRAQIGFLLWAAIVFSVVGNASRAGQLWQATTVYGVHPPTWSAVWLALPPLAYAGALHVLGLVHRYPAPDDQVADVAAVAAELAEARAEAEHLMTALDEAHRDRAALEASDGARARRAERARTATATTRAPSGARHDEVRALLAEPGGSALTGEQIGARLGITGGRARHLRAEVERADAQTGRRPHVVELDAAAPATAAVAEEA